MKKLVVFYSLEGNTKLMAESIAEAMQAEVLQLKLKKPISSKGLLKYVWGVKAVLMNEIPDLEPFNINIQEYDFLVLGTPVWAGSYAPALNTFFKQNKICNKKIAIFCCHQGMKGKISDKFKSVLKENKIVGEIDFIDPKVRDSDKNIQKVKEWASHLVQIV